MTTVGKQTQQPWRPSFYYNWSDRLCAWL